MPADLVHGAAAAVAVDADGPLAGVLIVGPSGAGKSSLALELIETCPWRRTALIADDAVLLSNGAAGAVHAAAPERIGGRIEIRGYGPALVRSLQGGARLTVAFDLAAAPARLPEPETRAFGSGCTLPAWPFAAGPGAAHRLRAILRAIMGGQIR